MIPTRDQTKELEMYLRSKMEGWSRTSRTIDFPTYELGLAKMVVALRGALPLYSAAWSDFYEGEAAFDSSHSLRFLAPEMWILVEYRKDQALPDVEVIPRRSLRRVSIHEVPFTIGISPKGSTSFSLHFEDRDLHFMARDPRFAWGDLEELLEVSLDDLIEGMDA